MFITKESYDKLVSEAADAKAANETLAADKAAAEQEIERLTTENAALAADKEALQSEIQSLKAESDAIKEQAEAGLNTQQAELTAELSEAKALVSELREMKNTWKPDARAAGDGKNTAKGASIDLDRVKEVIKIQNEK